MRRTDKKKTTRRNCDTVIVFNIIDSAEHNDWTRHHFMRFQERIKVN